MENNLTNAELAMRIAGKEMWTQESIKAITCCSDFSRYAVDSEPFCLGFSSKQGKQEVEFADGSRIAFDSIGGAYAVGR